MYLFTIRAVLEKCIESLIDLKMDKNNIEAIFVDDCSTDESVNIIKHYEKDYDFIKLIQLPENTGSLLNQETLE